MPTRAEHVEMPEAPLHLLIADTSAPAQTRKNQIDELINIAQHSWVAKSILGYTAVRAEDIKAIMLDQRWVSALHMLQSMRPGATNEIESRRSITLSAMPHEEHQRLRRAISHAFSPAAAEKNSPAVRSVAVDVLNKLIERGNTDFMSGFCEIYPVNALCKVIGLPESDWEQFFKWGYAMISPISASEIIDPKTLAQQEHELSAYLKSLFKQRRAEPQDDLLTTLAVASAQDGEMTENEALMLVGTFLAGGVETVTFALGNMLEYFCRRPDVYKEMRSNTPLIMNSVMETLRIISSVRGTVRMATEDIEYKDIIFPKGTFMFLNIAAGNLDKSIHQNPDVFDFYRGHHQDFTFGGGLHYCLGASLAKVEMREAIHEICKRFETIEIAEEITYRPSNAGVWGPTKLNIKYKEAQ